MEFTVVEIMGYIASIMVAISLTMKNIVKLRILNFVGCSFFVIYGLMIGATPVVLTNAFIACVNVYFIVKLYQDKTPNNVSSVSAQ